ncbi:MAG: phosphoserine transaminase, partial [Acidobacteriota bacterium]|nr:phosphoserine transaminase [Acidobacteriota bacterium]
MSSPETIKIPAELLPRDGRFGAGPSKIRPEQLEALAASGSSYLGTSHRQATVRNKVAEVQNGLKALFSLPDGYEVLLGNGGTTCFWDAATFHLVQEQSQHLSFGEFSSKFAQCVTDAPHLRNPQIIKSEVGTHPTAVSDDAV